MMSEKASHWPLEGYLWFLPILEIYEPAWIDQSLFGRHRIYFEGAFVDLEVEMGPL